MMIHKTWRVLLLVAFVMLLFCAIRTIRRPAASDAAQKPEVAPSRAPADGNESVMTPGELRLRQLETAQNAQSMKQQEAVTELQRRQQGTTRLRSGNPGVSMEALDVAATG